MTHAGIMDAFWPKSIQGDPRVSVEPGRCSGTRGGPCAAYTQQSYGGRLLCLLCAIDRRDAR